MTLKKWLGIGLFGVLTKVVLIAIFGITFF